MENKICNGCHLHSCDVNPKTNKSFYRCKTCRDARIEQNKQRKQDGKCRDCNNPSHGKTRCLACSRKTKKRLRAQGKCQSCGGKKDTTSSLCKRCILKNIANKSLKDTSRHSELLALLQAQGNQCAITGLPIELGVNASLDHIVPKNRGGNHNIDNLRWVHVIFNRMKNDMLDIEFMEWLTRLWDNKDKLYNGPPCRLNAPLGRSHSWPTGMNTSSEG